MAGIYESNISNALQSLVSRTADRTKEYDKRRSERAQRRADPISSLAKALGRSLTDNTPQEQARFDYIVEGDRSGLDSLRKAEEQAIENGRQREFQAFENEKNRIAQALENKANRESTMKLAELQHNYSVNNEYYKWLKDLRDAESQYQQTAEDVKNYKADQYALDRAKNTYEMLRSIGMERKYPGVEDLKEADIDFEKLTGAREFDAIANKENPTLADIDRAMELAPQLDSEGVVDYTKKAEDLQSKYRQNSDKVSETLFNDYLKMGAYDNADKLLEGIYDENKKSLLSLKLSNARAAVARRKKQAEDDKKAADKFVNPNKK